MNVKTNAESKRGDIKKLKTSKEMNCRYMDKLEAKANESYGEDEEITNSCKKFTTNIRQKLSKLH